MLCSVTDLPTGLRERKKQQTRDTISAVATRLFATRGFERVTIAEVADAADVSKMTVTNYFSLKEDLVFDQHEHITTLLANAVSARPDGTSVLAAVRRAYSDALARVDPTLGFRGAAFARMVDDSAALRAREREIFEQRESALAEVLAAETRAAPGDLKPQIAAVQLAGVFRILYYEGRRRLLAGEAEPDIIAALRRYARAAFHQVEHGLPGAFTSARATSGSPTRRPA
jgi:AcrR family transcriptional regulator